MNDLKPEQFQRIAAIAQEQWGLALSERKVALVSNRLNSYIRKSKFSSIDAYLEYLDHDAGEEDMLVFFDLLSTNVTSFFRDPAHFDFLEREFYTPLARENTTLPGRKIRIWSAGCSIGCEPYTMAINANESLPDIDQWDVRILASDLSNFAVQQAHTGRFESKIVQKMSPERVAAHFEKVPNDPTQMQARKHLRNMISVARLNLMDRWPMEGPFHVIFCRNVMIYFDAPTRKQLVQRFYDILAPGGILAVGSAETLSGLDVPFRSMQASVYCK